MSYYELYHHGIKGQKWGVRRFQDKNGRLTPAGKLHNAEREGGSLHGAATTVYQADPFYLVEKETGTVRPFSIAGDAKTFYSSPEIDWSE